MNVLVSITNFTVNIQGISQNNAAINFYPA